MHVADSPEKIRKRPKFFVDVDLLDIALVKALDVAGVFGIWTFENFLAAAPDCLPFDDWPLPIILRERDLVLPFRLRLCGITKSDAHYDIWISSGGK